MSFNNIAIAYVKGSAYRVNFWHMSKDEAMNIMNGSDLVDKNGANLTQNTNLTYYQRNRDVILNRAKDYYENNKERLREEARDKCRNLSEEEEKKEDME